MPKRIIIKKKKHQICLGDLKDRIVIQDRNIKAPQNGPDFSEKFDRNRTRKALINTVSGKVFFDGVGKETPITHNIYFRFDKNITNENWILFKKERYKILQLTNLDERNKWFLAECTDRGDAAKLASGA